MKIIENRKNKEKLSEKLWGNFKFLRGHLTKKRNSLHREKKKIYRKEKRDSGNNEKFEGRQQTNIMTDTRGSRDENDEKIVYIKRRLRMYNILKL